MEKPIVSVIVPFYNAEEFMEDCLRDICGQTYRNLDILFVNDGSTDGGAELVASCQREDSRIRMLNQKKETTGAARNRGLEAAKGEYVLFLDADDRFAPTMVEKMVAAVQDRDADFVICGSKALDHNSQENRLLSGSLRTDLLPDMPVFSWRDIPETIFQLTAGWAWDKLYRTNFLRKRHLRFPNWPNSEDELFVGMAFVDAERICVIEDVLVTHRINRKTSMVGSRSLHWRCGYDLLFSWREELLKRGFFQALERSFINRAADYSNPT